MKRRPRKVRAWLCVGAITLVGGCATQSPLPFGALIRDPLPPPELPPPPKPADLPLPPLDPEEDEVREGKPVDFRPGVDPNSPLMLTEVLRSVEAAFPLLYAIEQERQIASGLRLAAEGQFDPMLRAGGVDQSGTFSSARFNTSVEQATPFAGISTFAGWRRGTGNFPVYYGDRKTGQGGEFQAGLNVPLLQNRDIDPRRARLRAAQIGEQLADPVVRRARLDFFMSSAHAYWRWQKAGGDYRVAQYLLKLATDRQVFLDEQLALGEVNISVVVLNRRLVASRQEELLRFERRLQESALRLSLFLRDAAGNPVVPPSEWLIDDFLNLIPPPPDPDQLASDVERAYNLRPELVRFRFEKEQRAVELQMATNQLMPELNAFAAVSQDVGIAKTTFTGTGPFKTDRTTAEVGATFALPLPLRTPRGLINTARAQLAQLLAQERYTRDEIAAQVQDAVSELDLTYKRIDRAREELRQANRVLELDTIRFREQFITLIELNLQEIAAAEAQTRLIDNIGLYFQAVAFYLASLGIDGVPDEGGAVLSNIKPIPPEEMPEFEPIEPVKLPKLKAVPADTVPKIKPIPPEDLPGGKKPAAPEPLPAPKLVPKPDAKKPDDEKPDAKEP